MGQTLSEPVTEKQSSVCQDGRFKVGASCMQGWRVSMEDSHTHILSLPDDPDTAFFAVYDGHGGATIAQYAGKHLHKYVVKRPEYQTGNIEESLKQGFMELDAAMQKEESLREEVAGSTAVVVLIKNNICYCANVGDSRAVASINGRAEPLSMDHKPNNEGELRRILAGGGRVEFNRVNGNLALSRALGDFGFKSNVNIPAQDQIVTAYPDVVIRQITDDWEFLVIACDGIWDVLSSQDVVDYCRTSLRDGMEPSEVCEKLMQVCLAPDCAMGGLGCDNMTVLLVCLTNGITYSDFQAKIQRPPLLEAVNKDEPSEGSKEGSSPEPPEPEKGSGGTVAGAGENKEQAVSSEKEEGASKKEKSDEEDEGLA